jgi:hypothetical protein
MRPPSTCRPTRPAHFQRRERLGARLGPSVMSSSKRPSTSSLRRFISSRPYVPVAEIRRRFEIDDLECMCRVERDGQIAFLGLPDREGSKIQELWVRDEIGLELSVEIRAPVVIGVYPMRIARYVADGNRFGSNGHRPGINHANDPAPRGQHLSPQVHRSAPARDAAGSR